MPSQTWDYESSTLSTSIDSSNTHRSLSGTGETLYSASVDYMIGCSRFWIDATMTGHNHGGSGQYPRLGVRVRNSNGGTMYDLGSVVTFNGDGTFSFTEEVTSDPSAEVTSEVTVEIYDEAGGGGYDDAVLDMTADVEFDTRPGVGVFEVPNFVSEVTVECWGAGGADGGGDQFSSGASGGKVEGQLPVEEGDILQIIVGEEGTTGGPGGFPNGGDGAVGYGADGGGGGGSSEVRLNGQTVGHRVAVAGGGGGGGGISTSDGGDQSTGAGGAGGGDAEDGGTAHDPVSDVPGGAGGGMSGPEGEDSQDGSDTTNYGAGAVSGAGGGGASGGQAGGSSASGGPDEDDANAAGGGGGDGSIDGLETGFMSRTGNFGNGQVTITWTRDSLDLSVTAQSSDAIDLDWIDTSGEDGYRILRSQNPGSTGDDYYRIAGLGANESSYRDDGLEDGEVYYYRAQAYTGSDTLLSDEGSAQTVLSWPEISDIYVLSDTEMQINWDQNDDSTDGFWEVYRSETLGDLGTQIYRSDRIAQTACRDTGLTTDTRYWYTVRRITDHDTVDSPQDFGAIMSEPSNVQVSSVDGDQISITWDHSSTVEQGYRVHVSEGGGTDWEQNGDSLPENSTSFQTTPLLDGEEYSLRVQVYGGSSTAESASVTATTAIPDAQAPSLGNSVNRTINVEWPDVLDNGEYRIQYKESSASSWTDWDTVDHDTTQATITNLRDGETYDVRLRTQTSAVTGAWTAGISITTNFPELDELGIDATRTTEADISWNDPYDNENQWTVYHRKQYDAGWGDWIFVEELPPGTTSYTDATLQPGDTYQFRVEASTEHSTESIESSSTETNSLNIQRGAERGANWYIEVEHSSGAVHTPTVLEDGTEWLPRLNDQPRIEIAVPKSDKWESGSFEGQPVTVWKDGDELPVDRVVSISREQGQDIIEAKGGVELEQDVSALTYPEEDSHVAAEDAVTTHTPYAFDGDDPSVTSRDNVLLQSIDWADEFEALAQGDPFVETKPLDAFGNDVTCHPTAQFVEAETGAGSFTYFADNEGNDGAWSGNEAKRVQPGETLEIEWSNLEYIVPYENAYAEVVFSTPEAPTPAIRFEVDVWGESTYTIDDTTEDTFIQDDTKFDLTPFTVPLNTDQGYAGDLEDHTHTLRITNKSNSSTDMWVDFVHFYDNRYSYTQSDTNPVDEVVTGWEAYPETLSLTFDPTESIEQINSGQLEVGMSNTLGAQSIGLRNDTNNAFDTAANTDTHSVDFATPSQIAQAQITMSRYDSGGGESGDFGDEFQDLSYVGLSGDLVNTPVLLDFVHNGEFKEALNRIADSGDFIWEVRRIDGEDTIVWTQPGLRTTETEPDVIDYSGRRTIENSYQKVIATGKSRAEEGEEFQASSYGATRGFSEGPPLIPGKETIYDTGEDPTVYERGIDYEMDFELGGIKLLSGGSMSTSTTYLADYSWQYEGVYTDPDADDPDTHRTSFPDASSERECEQLARSVVRAVSEPLEEVSVTIRDVDPGQPLTEAIEPQQLPFDGPYRVREIKTQPEQIEQVLGSRRDAAEIISELGSRISALARNV